jgi:hypothetical protein
VKTSGSYKLTIAQKPGYLHAVATGSNSVESMTGYLEELVRECEARGCRRVLIEERLDGPRLGTVDVYDLASGMSDRALGLFEAIAYVDVNAESDRNIKFGENVVVNRGLQAKMFRSVEDAAKWLES